MGIILTLIVVLVPLSVVLSMPVPHLTPKVLLLIALLDIGFLWGIFTQWRRQSGLQAKLGSGKIGTLAQVLIIAWLLVLAAYSARGEYLGWGSLLRANGWWVWLHVMGGIASAVLFLKEGQRMKVLQAVAGMGTVVAGLGLIGKIAPGAPIIGATGSAISTWGSSSFLAGYLLLTLGATGVQYARTRVGIRGWWIVAALVQVTTLVVTDSRAGLLGLLTGITIVGLWHVLRMPAKQTRWVRVALGVLVVLFVAAQFAPAAWDLPRGLRIAPKAATSQTRLLQWQIAWGAIKEKPWGWGRGAYPEIFAAHFDPASLTHVESEAFTDEAHNVLLMTGVEMGVIGMLVWSALLITIAVLAWRVSPWAIGIVGAYSVYLFFTPEQPIVAAHFWLVVACMVAVAKNAESLPRVRTKAYSRWLLVGVGVLVAVSAVHVMKYTSTFAAYGTAEKSRMAGRWFPWLELVEHIGADQVPASCQLWEKAMQTWIAVAGNTQMPEDIRVRTAQNLEKRADVCTQHQQRFYRTYLLAQYYGQQAVRNGNEWIVRAQQTFAQAQSLSPRHPYPGYAEGQFLIEINRISDAITRLEQVRTATPDAREVYLYLYLAYRLNGDAVRAEEIQKEGLTRGAVFPEL